MAPVTIASAGRFLPKLKITKKLVVLHWPRVTDSTFTINLLTAVPIVLKEKPLHFSSGS